MKLYLKTGRRALAARQFEACRDALKAELDVEPLEETVATYAQACAASTQRALSSTARPANNPEAVLERLRRALQMIDRARDEFSNLIHSLERTTPGRHKP
jgi:DNA-binding SARP family transcriptional activator